MSSETTSSRLQSPLRRSPDRDLWGNGRARVGIEPKNKGFADHLSNHFNLVKIKELNMNPNYWDPAWDPLRG